MGDLNGAAEINAQLQALQAGQAQLVETLNALTAQMNLMGQGNQNQPNGQPAARRFGPYLNQPQSESEEDEGKHTLSETASRSSFCSKDFTACDFPVETGDFPLDFMAVAVDVVEVFD
ncbi:Uncharacterized protein Rs2_38478 [Raphanus sativus]|nr:Uncharacterized protein Rs2_38478 [Raphanus sativus]